MKRKLHIKDYNEPIEFERKRGRVILEESEWDRLVSILSYEIHLHKIYKQASSFKDGIIHNLTVCDDLFENLKSMSEVEDEEVET